MSQIDSIRNLRRWLKICIEFSTYQEYVISHLSKGYFQAKIYITHGFKQEIDQKHRRLMNAIFRNFSCRVNKKRLYTLTRKGTLRVLQV